MKYVDTDTAGLRKIIRDLRSEGTISQMNGVPLRIIPVSEYRYRVHLKRYQYAALVDLARTRSVEERYGAAPTQ